MCVALFARELSRAGAIGNAASEDGWDAKNIMERNKSKQIAPPV
jgi:hypothetical protein